MKLFRMGRKVKKKMGHGRVTPREIEMYCRLRKSLFSLVVGDRRGPPTLILQCL